MMTKTYTQERSTFFVHDVRRNPLIEKIQKPAYISFPTWFPHRGCLPYVQGADPPSYFHLAATPANSEFKISTNKPEEQEYRPAFLGQASIRSSDGFFSVCKDSMAIREAVFEKAMDHAIRYCF